MVFLTRIYPYTSKVLIALTRFLPQLLAIRALTTSPSTSGVSDILSPLQTDQRFKRIRKIGILTYKDYYPVPTHLYPNQIGSIVHPIPANDQAAAALQPKMKIEDVLAWSGWDDPQLVDSNRDGKERSTGLESQYLSEWVKGIAAEGGGDYPEAAKSALRRLLDIVVAESTQAAVETVVLWYTDAPPHHRCHRGINRVLEIGAHGCTPTERGWDCQSDGPSQSSAAPASNRNEDKSRPPQQLPPTISMQPYISKMNFPGPAPSTVPASRCIDWIYMTRQSKDAGLRVYTILPPSMPDMDASFYAVLGATTGGGVFVVGGKESKKDKGKEKEKEKTKEEDGDGSGWYNELMISGGAPFVKAITALSLEIVLALVGLEDPGSRITDPNEDTQMEDDAVSAKMEISEPPKTGRGGFRGVRSDRRRRGYWSRGHYYPPRGRRHRPGNRPFTLRDTSEDELELEEMLQEELTGKDMPIQWLSYEEDVVSYMNGRPAPEKEPETTTKAEEPLEPTPEKAQQQEQPDTQPSAPTEPAAEAQTQVAPRLIRIDDEENALGFLPYPWRGPTQPGAWLKKILRENVEGVELTKRIVRHGEEETTKDENEKGKSNEGGSAQMETSVYAEANETPSEAITFLLKRIVDMDVEAIPRVWLFAGIWRSSTFYSYFFGLSMRLTNPTLVGKQSSNNLQQSLFALFSDRVDNIKKEDLRKRLKDWAAINHDASAEITQLLGKTTIAEQENLVLSLDDDAAGQSGLRKEDALDLTKTCDKKLLKKMGYLLRYTKVRYSSNISHLSHDTYAIHI